MGEKETSAGGGKNAPAKKPVVLHCQTSEALNYAKIHNGKPLINSVVLENLTESKISDLGLVLESDTLLSETFAVKLPTLPPGAYKFPIENKDLTINTQFLASLTEQCTCQITATLIHKDEILDQDIDNITVFAFDQWSGAPELLPSFVMPNHPVVKSLLQLASKYLASKGKSPSLEDYQSGDRNRVKELAGAAYAAVQKKNISYATSPASFAGQRIRLPDEILENHLGTCMDMTLLYAGCLEAMGLHPLLILRTGHIFAGVWLEENLSNQQFISDPVKLERLSFRGSNVLTAVECTCMCAGEAGKLVEFDDAVLSAEGKLAAHEGFKCAIDVNFARRQGILPLPVRVKTNAGFEVRHEDRKLRDLTPLPNKAGPAIELPDYEKKEPVTKQTQWERKLLDLSTRNSLINTRVNGSVIPILSPELTVLEDALADGEEFKVFPWPFKKNVDADHCPVDFLDWRESERIQNESLMKKLYSLYKGTELNSCLTKLYRSAKSSLEENGASTLYLTLGMLRWFEDEKCETPHYAPIVLLPIEIIRKSANQGYSLCMRDEDAQVNVTLLEFLRQEKSINVPGMDPPPKDEHGLNLRQIFATFNGAVMGLKNWMVVEVAFIGNFSFTQFMMWNDIHSNPGFLEHNKIVRSLINGYVDWDTSIPENVKTDEAYLPVTVDDSQLHAINMAAADVSFVLHGPPGTGKSQTITAMIANALTKGKTILFVAEKKAALEVVQKRLAALGIGDFCLELHSNKATKKSVLDQLKRGLEADDPGRRTNYDRKIQDIRRMRDDLNAYAKALHAVRPCGKSLRQLIDRYEMIPDPGVNVHFDPAWISTLTEGDLEHQRQALERLAAAGKAVGHPHDHPLQAIQQTEYSQRVKFELEDLVRTWSVSLHLLQGEAGSFIHLIGMQMPVSASEWRDLLDLADTIADTEEIPDFIRLEKHPEQAFAKAEHILSLRSELAEKKSALLVSWNRQFLKADLQRLREKYEEADQKFFGKKKALEALTAELQAYARFTVQTEQIPLYLTEAELWQKAEAELAAEEAALPVEWRTVLDKYPSVDSLRTYQSTVLQQVRNQSCHAEMLQKLAQSGKLQAVRKQAEEVRLAMAAEQEAERAVNELLNLSFDSAEEERDWHGIRRILSNDILEHSSFVRDWMQYRRQDEECRKLGLGPVCEAYAEGLEHEKLVPVYQHSVTRMLILSVIEAEPSLNHFTGVGFNEQIAQFKKLDKDFMDLTRQEMRVQLKRQLPRSSESVEISKELNILRKAIQSGGRGMSVRSLFEQIPHVLQRMCPCMLMSPISAAQYLQPINDQFDVIVFDEASQLPTCKAVGVLARGRNAVIVGDPNQMPPTSFFTGSTLDEDDLENEDLDSILDDCLALGMPQAELQWHYRSRHESLIAYSNREFYDNGMYTFPSANDRERRVRFVHVDGCFERSKKRVNRAEAEAVVAEIQRRYRDPERSGQSVGVVTFNITQQALIEDLLQEAYRKDPGFDRWATAGEDPLFVKNLENVQGDERDVILFSVAYGRDTDGKLYMNFGPLNNDDGWKRLNVAITRARCEMVVFSSITSDMIDLKRASSKGVEALKGFLSFAEKGYLQNESGGTQADPNQGILRAICRTLEDGGWQYQTAVGHSDFRVDIAVVNPYAPGEYLLGIMLDGESYRQSANARDREISQISVLEGLGWHLHRIWAMDWWDNRERELARLTELLEDCRAEAQARQRAEQAAAEKSAEETAAQTASAEMESAEEQIPAPAPREAEQKPEPKTAPKPASELKPTPEEAAEQPAQARPRLHYRKEVYREAVTSLGTLSAEAYTDPDNLSVIVRRMKEILQTEAPIPADQLIRKTLDSFGIESGGTAIQEVSEKAVRRAGTVKKQRGTVFCWQKDQDPGSYAVFRTAPNQDARRKPGEIAEQEVKNAVCITLLENGSLTKEELIKRTVRLMGYARTGSALKAAVERGISLGKRTGEILAEDDRLTLAVPAAEPEPTETPVIPPEDSSSDEPEETAPEQDPYALEVERMLQNWYLGGTSQEPLPLWNALHRGLQNNMRVLVPFNPTKEFMEHLQNPKPGEEPPAPDLLLLSAGDEGKYFLPAFTSFNAMENFPEKSTLRYSLLPFLQTFDNDPNCLGIEINPAGTKLYLTQETLPLLKAWKPKSLMGLIQCEITDLYADVFICPDDNALSGSTAAAAVIHAAAGPKLQKVCRKLKGCGTGSALVTGAFDFAHADFIIHTAVPTGSDEEAQKSLMSCYLNALELAYDRGCTSIVIPDISAERTGMSQEMAANLAYYTTYHWLEQHSDAVLNIFFCPTSDDALNAYKKIMGR